MKAPTLDTTKARITVKIGAILEAVDSNSVALEVKLALVNFAITLKVAAEVGIKAQSDIDKAAYVDDAFINRSRSGLRDCHH